ncbi:hypothetical protein HYR54_05820 [Candidatus Acetothermia bacterium]|nr:hypothetical protein [Candidatus Acetothermia bacterium]
MSDASVAAVNNKLYVIGGFINNGQLVSVDTVQEYDPATDSWQIRAHMPSARGLAAVVVFNNNIYVMGGTTTDDHGNGTGIYAGVVEVYDPLTDSWTAEGFIPHHIVITGRLEAAAGVLNGRIYVVGFVEVVDEFDPISGPTSLWGWHHMDAESNLPVPTGYSFVGSRGAVVNDRFYVFNGAEVDEGTVLPSTASSTISQIRITGLQEYLKEINAGSDLQLTIFDLSGKELSNRWLSIEQLLQEGTQTEKTSLSNGVYLYVLTVHRPNGNTERKVFKKLILR